MSAPFASSTPARPQISVLYINVNGCASSAMLRRRPSNSPLSQIGLVKVELSTPSSASRSTSQASSSPPGAQPGTRDACMIATSGARPPAAAMASFV